MMNMMKILPRVPRASVLTGASMRHRTTSLAPLLLPFLGVVTSSSRQQDRQSRFGSWLAASIVAGGSCFLTASISHCDYHHHSMPNPIGNAPDFESMPVYSAKEIANHDGTDGGRIWMTYGGIVYDMTEFIQNHPGGAQKILTAAGSAIEPFWNLYRQHYASDLPMTLLEHLAIGRVSDEYQDQVDKTMEELEEHDPFRDEPARHESLHVHSDTPMVAECTAETLQSYITSSDKFYVRNHHPVPLMTKEEMKDFRLQIDLTRYGKGVAEFTLAELQAMKSTEVTTTLQCSGNRRGEFNGHKQTSGTAWGQGAISTSVFKGVRLSELLQHAGLDDFIAAQEKVGLEHVRMHSLDGMMASVGIEKALNPYGDVIVCYEMNGDPLPRDHGFPLRMIVPGYAAVRNVKWLQRIELAKTEAEGPWQRGLNYKTLPPGSTDSNGLDIEKMPSMTEASLFSGITKVDVPKNARLGEVVTVKASGWAWAGGGRNIVRVDVSGDSGESWTSAELKEGSNQRFGRAWAWTFWECNVDCKVQNDGKIRLSSKSVDLAHNVQPENPKHSWNVRGLGNNTWYTRQIQVS